MILPRAGLGRAVSCRCSSDVGSNCSSNYLRGYLCICHVHNVRVGMSYPLSQLAISCTNQFFR